jgi:hypothetical protein
MWSNLLREYPGDLAGILIMALIPYLGWAEGRLKSLMADGQVERIPRWLRWIVLTDPVFRKRMERGEIPRGSKRWIILVLGIGLILPTLHLVLPSPDPLGHRIVVILASAVLFLLAVALLEWLVRPRRDKGQ